MTDSPLEILGKAERATLRDIVLSLADTTLLLGYRAHERAPRSPSMNDANALEGVSTGLFGESYLLFDFLEPLGESPEQLERRNVPIDFSSIELLDHDFSTWQGFLIAASLTHVATTVRWHTLALGNIADLAGLAKKVVQEARFHTLYLSGAYQAHIARHTGAEENFLSAVESLLPIALRWFGQDSPQIRTLVDKGILTRAPEQERTAFLNSLRHIIPTGAEQGWKVAPLDWNEWDARRHRSAGTGPDPQTLHILSLKTIDDSIVWERAEGRSL